MTGIKPYIDLFPGIEEWLSIGEVATQQILYLSYNISDYGMIFDGKMEV